MDSDIIYMIDEAMRFIPYAGGCFSDAEKLCQLIKKHPKDKPIRIVITTNGGDMISIQIIMHYLSLHREGYIVYIRGKCFSAGTILALGAKEIIMDEYSNLGKIDPMKYNGIFSGAKQTIVDYHLGKNNNIEKKYKDMLDIEEAEMSINGVLNILKKSNLPTRIYDQIIEEFLYSKKLHGTPYYYDDCEKLGLNVRKPYNHELQFYDVDIEMIQDYKKKSYFSFQLSKIKNFFCSDAFLVSSTSMGIYMMIYFYCRKQIFNQILIEKNPIS